jgi:hypothetical protein
VQIVTSPGAAPSHPAWIPHPAVFEDVSTGTFSVVEEHATKSEI